ncbi:hypothetical protein MTR67_030594 [Solanum verrucosum]|uniref:Uncharacterized protein n=1 Tax=Solanum verrucosum TaxID=315347 RepID=A0AAF0TYG7_SOLVR|nr:hypothetical protein MTR67_030594 [Solanum verrucosum]
MKGLRGNGNIGRGAVQPSKEVAHRDDKARFYAFPGKIEVEASYAVITCTILICDQMAIVCLNLSSTCSYVSVQFALGFDADFEVESPSIKSIPVVLEIREVFPTDLPDMPPDRDIDFCIDLKTGTHPISIPPYCMALVELRDLKSQIQELLDKVVDQGYQSCDVLLVEWDDYEDLVISDDIFGVVLKFLKHSIGWFEVGDVKTLRGNEIRQGGIIPARCNTPKLVGSGIANPFGASPKGLPHRQVGWLLGVRCWKSWRTKGPLGELNRVGWQRLS